jgi:hypothetical protein
MYGKGCTLKCTDYTPERTYKAFGWDVTVRFQDGHTEIFHWRGCTENRARRKAMMKRCSVQIISVVPVTEAEWLRAYGLGRM